MAKPVHSMIRVLDEARSLDFYARAFGLQIADRLVFPDFALVYLHHVSSPFELELTVNFGRKEPYSPGDGYGHLAVVVDNLDAEHARFRPYKGCRPDNATRTTGQAASGSRMTQTPPMRGAGPLLRRDARSDTEFGWRAYL